jgi:hypothetical protein
MIITGHVFIFNKFLLLDYPKIINCFFSFCSTNFVQKMKKNIKLLKPQNWEEKKEKKRRALMFMSFLKHFQSSKELNK